MDEDDDDDDDDNQWVLFLRDPVILSWEDQANSCQIRIDYRSAILITSHVIGRRVGLRELMNAIQPKGYILGDHSLPHPREEMDDKRTTEARN